MATKNNDINIYIDVEIKKIDGLKDVLKEVKEILKKECNVTCTLNIKVKKKL